MEVNVNDLTGMALDWAVAKACGLLGDHIYTMATMPDGECRRPVFIDGEAIYSPSTNWAHGGPLIDQFKPDLNTWGNCQLLAELHGDPDDSSLFIACQGETYLIAACRCIVVNKLGSVVNVPDELL